MQQRALSNDTDASGPKPAATTAITYYGLILAAAANLALPAANVNVHLSATTLAQRVSLPQEIPQHCNTVTIIIHSNRSSVFLLFKVREPLRGAGVTL